MSERTFRLRFAQLGDEAVILSMQRKLALYCHTEERSFRNTEANLRLRLKDRDTTPIILVTIADQPVAFMIMLKIPIGLGWSGVGGIRVEDIFVEETYRRGFGIGRELMAQAASLAIEIAERGGYAPGAFVWLDTSKVDNSDSIAFYDHLGMTTENHNYRIGGIELARLSRRAASLVT